MCLSFYYGRVRCDIERYVGGISMKKRLIYGIAILVIGAGAYLFYSKEKQKNSKKTTMFFFYTFDIFLYVLVTWHIISWILCIVN